jgi:F-type H+-transporting ATPase subunit delta
MIDNVPKQYAEALVLLDLDTKETVDNLNLVRAALENDQFVKFLEHPLISNEEKREVIEKTFSDFKKDLISFLFVLIDNKRINILDDIISSYTYINDESNNIMSVEIISSNELTNEQIIAIIATLETRFKKKIKTTMVIDASIIGGLIIKYNGQVLDDSVIGKLKSLKEATGV